MQEDQWSNVHIAILGFIYHVQKFAKRTFLRHLCANIAGTILSQRESQIASGWKSDWRFSREWKPAKISVNVMVWMWYDSTVCVVFIFMELKTSKNVFNRWKITTGHSSNFHMRCCHWQHKCCILYIDTMEGETEKSAVCDIKFSFFLKQISNTSII